MTNLEIFNQAMNWLAAAKSQLSRDAFQWLRPLVDRVNQISPAVGDLRAIGKISLLRDGELKADGSAISRTAYAELFALYGTTYGAGNGTTTFNLPNYTSATPAIWAVRVL